MIIFLSGPSHTGKTAMAQRLLEKYHFPYLSIDHLKMGLIRSGVTDLTVFDDDKLTDFLWPILREMVKTAIENGQSLIVEGCYIPPTWREDFDERYLPHIRALWLIMSRRYIETHFTAIRDNANAIEQRLNDSDLNPADLIRDNEAALAACQAHNCPYYLIDEAYPSHPEDLI